MCGGVHYGEVEGLVSVERRSTTHTQNGYHRLLAAHPPGLPFLLLLALLLLQLLSYSVSETVILSSSPSHLHILIVVLVICKQDSALIREMSPIQSVLHREVPLYTKRPVAVSPHTPLPSPLTHQYLPNCESVDTINLIRQHQPW